MTTLVGAAVACGHREGAGSPPASQEPPAAAPPAAPAPAAPAPASSPFGEGSRVLNPVDAQGRTVFRRPDGTCYVTAPPDAPAGDKTVSFQPPVMVDASCPPGMSGPEWEACGHGLIRADVSGTSCACVLLGNPPPPPRPLASCPPSPEVR